jgi:leader peptidase (prepilin peptidase)/N-methyltransferase
MNHGATASRRDDTGTPAGRMLPMAAAAALVALWAAMVDADWLRLLLDCALGWGLLALAWIDWRQLRLPDALTLPLLAAGLAAAGLEGADALLADVIGALAGYAALRLVGEGYLRLRGREGLGQGDAKLLAAGGAWLGWEALPWVVLLAALLGLALAALQRVRGVALTREKAVPFGPPLALAIWIIRLHGFPEI